MKQSVKVLLLFVSIVITFLISLLTYYNDLKNYTILFSFITVVLLVFMIYIIFKRNDSKSIYKKQVKKILKIYNSQLVKINDNYELLNENFVNAKNIEDMFELSDEFNQPIVYIEEDNASIFILQYGKDILYYVLKENNNIITNFEKQINEYKESKKEKKDNQEELLSNINKTTIIQMKNNKFYKIKPIKK